MVAHHLIFMYFICVLSVTLKLCGIKLLKALAATKFCALKYEMTNVSCFNSLNLSLYH